ncbi:DUF4082 domain-containing protein [Paracoccus sp. TK19116]|uniref:DUF4082 domain-containing protein n=1 Tax=Paracoccus albicereus TaxID=2922394 RepID=A0ABT1MW97_9RHOB|nr:DUF4082 domain-containing protein [Paracoccus albicereus]MCQ0971796.1 DUF4082 domain-containing protein [Paracoccus albicereus]
MVIPRIRPLAAAAFCVAMSLAGTGASAATSPAVTLNNTPATVVETQDFSVGYRFEALENLNVTALGAYDAGLDGFAGRAELGLFSLSGTLLASATITGAQGTLVSQFRYANLLSPVSISKGTEYVLGAWFSERNGIFNSNYGAQEGGRVSLTSDVIRLLRNRDLPNTGQLVFPSREPSNSHLGTFGPNMLAEIAPVPVPAAGLLLLGGIGTLAAMRRRTRRT